MSIEDGTQSISDLLSVKDQDEQAKLKVASDITSSVLKEFLIPQIEDIIEKEEKITHIALAEKTEELMSKPEKLAKVLKSKQPTDDVESCYTPIIMSGGNFDLKPSAQSDESLINYSGVVIVSLGARYSSYCSNISRTLIIDASDDQKKAYRTLEKVYNACLSAFKVGAKLSDVYKTAIKYLRTKEPDLEKHFVKNCGFSVRVVHLFIFINFCSWVLIFVIQIIC
jgi:nucleosome binding factor SPN SPT16 subunit